MRHFINKNCYVLKLSVSVVLLGLLGCKSQFQTLPNNLTSPTADQSSTGPGAAPAPVPTQTISSDYSTYQGNTAWWALNNTWGNAGMTNGADYTESLIVTPSTFPNDTLIEWSWPNVANTSNVRAYPEVIYGNQSGNDYPSPNGMAPAPRSIGSLSTFSGTFNITLGGQKDGYDVLWETQLTSGPTGANEHEIGIMLHAPQFLRDYALGLSQLYRYNSPGFSATICIVPDNGGGIPFIIILPDSGDVLSGTIDILSIYKYLIAVGVLNPNEYLVGYELGAEAYYGKGSLTINNLSYDWQ